ncbi:G/T mismatch-specific thymine DNA glycosylase-like isoform X2 [Rhizophagus clarus]|uniref:G/T mismatch-specific thymine DNA glycosylase-like isoform X2 n=1 Tax=Rhizophagus clarus TaxID=94130 RepID=A0A8H3M814_9GLOM|nr:G/T mismatch-specific thymine DNA glycosylase-like isoform X2 [Rhizophagus clarus]
MFVTRPMKTYKSSFNKFSQSNLTQHLASKNTRKQTGKMKDNTRGQEVPTNKSSELPVPDIIDYNLNVLFVGLFSGKKSIKERHHYSSSNNHFYYALYESGMTNGDHLTYLDDQRLARDYKIGIVTLASRPEHRSKTKLSFEEIKQEFPKLLEKVEKYRPKVLCFNGRAMFQAFAVFQNARINSSTKRKKILTEDWGKQPNFSIRWNDHTGYTKVFYVISTSGRVFQHKRQNKIEYFKKLKELIDEYSDQKDIKYIRREEQRVIDTKIKEGSIDLVNAYFEEEFNNEQDDGENDMEDTPPNKKCKFEDFSPPKSFKAKRCINNTLSQKSHLILRCTAES